MKLKKRENPVGLKEGVKKLWDLCSWNYTRGKENYIFAGIGGFSSVRDINFIPVH